MFVALLLTYSWLADGDHWLIIAQWPPETMLFLRQYSIRGGFQGLIPFTFYTMKWHAIFTGHFSPTETVAETEAGTPRQDLGRADAPFESLARQEINEIFLAKLTQKVWKWSNLNNKSALIFRGANKTSWAQFVSQSAGSVDVKYNIFPSLSWKY